MTIEVWAWLLVILAIADWGATVTLVRAALRIHESALEERATAAVILTIAASGAGLLSLAFLAKIQLPAGLGTALLVAILLLVSLPQLIWYAAYRNGRFR